MHKCQLFLRKGVPKTYFVSKGKQIIEEKSLREIPEKITSRNLISERI